MKRDIKNFLPKELKKETVFEWSVYLFVFTLPLWRNVNTIFIWSMVASWLFASDWKTKMETFKQNRTSFIFIISLYALFWIGLIFSIDQKDNFRDIERTMVFFIFPLILLSTKPSHFNLKKIMIALGIGLFIGIIVCWAHVITDIFSKVDPKEQAKYFFQWIYSDWKLLKPLDVHPSYFAVMLVLFVSTLTFDKAFSNFRKKKFIFLFLLFIFLLFLLETSSRIGFILLVLIGIFNILKLGNRKEKILSLSVIAVILLFSFQFDYLSNKFQKILDADGNIGFERVHRWTKIVDVFLESKDFIFGTGSGDVDSIYSEAYERGNFDLALKEKYNAHNQYLEFFVGNGILGVFVYLMVIGYFIFKTKLRSTYHLGFFLIVLLFSVTESIFCRSKGVFFFAFFYSVLVNRFNFNYE